MTCWQGKMRQMRICTDNTQGKNKIEEEIVTANVTDTEGSLKQITNHVKTWETLSFEDRQAI